MSNLINPNKNYQETLSLNNDENKNDSYPKIYSKCVSTHDDVCFLDNGDFYHQD